MEQSLFGVGEDVLGHILSTFLNVKSLVNFAIAGYHANSRPLLLNVHFGLHDAEQVTPSSIHIINRAFRIKSLTFELGQAWVLRRDMVAERIPRIGERQYTGTLGNHSVESIMGHFPPNCITDPLGIHSFSNASLRRERIIQRIPFLLPPLSNLERLEICINECQTAVDEDTLATFFENLALLFKGGFCQKVCHIKVKGLAYYLGDLTETDDDLSSLPEDLPDLVRCSYLGRPIETLCESLKLSTKSKQKFVYGLFDGQKKKEVDEVFLFQ